MAYKKEVNNVARKAYLKRTAEEIGLTEYQLRRRAKEHKIPYLMSGKRYIFDIDLCLEYLRTEALGNANQQEESIQYGKLRKLSV